LFLKDFFAICGFSHTVLALFARFTPFLRQKCLFFAFSYAGDDFTAFCSFLRLFRLFGALFAFLGYLAPHKAYLPVIAPGSHVFGHFEGVLRRFGYVESVCGRLRRSQAHFRLSWANSRLLRANSRLLWANSQLLQANSRYRGRIPGKFPDPPCYGVIFAAHKAFLGATCAFPCNREKFSAHGSFYGSRGEIPPHFLRLEPISCET
jgi:hypothetical protein